MIQTKAELTDATLYLKDGSKKFVALFTEILHSQEQLIQFISNSNLAKFSISNNPELIESIETTKVDGIDIALK